ncbi:uncharacterized protein LOC132700906 [Cylas formicarius]|uniref:uncharacterized protein LOC132700906 n=1 Tax=Cylas formicarius TaxID=197179 RepID=UPI002958B692|nr:uncharacterized protein LOC132700906 [Cylas formicarius]
MDDDTFYDSLDEEADFLEVTAEACESNLVPFFAGAVEKNEVNSLKALSKNGSCTEIKKHSNAQKPILPPVRRKNNSYLNIFYSRNRGKEFSAREERSPTNSLCVNDFEKSCYFDGEQHGERLRKLDQESVGSSHKDEEPSTLTQISGNVRNKLNFVSKPVKICEMGGLGPNIHNVQDKLELLRKRQNYGKSVSEKNRIRIFESKVVQQLRREIEESHKPLCKK